MGVMVVGLVVWVAHPPPFGGWAWKREREVSFVFPREKVVSLRGITPDEQLLQYLQVINMAELFVEEAEAASYVKEINLPLAGRRLVEYLS